MLYRQSRRRHGICGGMARNKLYMPDKIVVYPLSY
jgi:hypothetical protein